MNDGCPSNSGLCLHAVRQLLAVIACALFAQTTAIASPSAAVADFETSRSSLRGNEPAALRNPALQSNRLGTLPSYNHRDNWLNWSKPIPQVEKPSAMTANSKLLGLSLIDEVSRLLSVL